MSAEASGHIDLDAILRPDVTVTFRGEEYILKPAPEGIVIKWRVAQGLRMSNGQMVADTAKLHEAQSVLVSGCLYKDGKNVNLAVVRTWPSEGVSILHDRAMDISGLRIKPKTKKEITEEIERLQKQLADITDEESGESIEDQEKNLSDDMTVTSG